jgi:hypothetical protein
MIGIASCSQSLTSQKGNRLAGIVIGTLLQERKAVLQRRQRLPENLRPAQTFKDPDCEKCNVFCVDLR